MIPTERPRLIFRFLQLLMIPALLMFGYHLLSFAFGNTNLPTIPDLNFGVSLFIAIVVAPATVIIGLWCLRRSPGNVVGPLLVLWGVGVLDYMRSDPLPIGAGFSSLYAGVRWSALFAVIVYFPDGNVVPPRFQRLIDALVILAFVMGIVGGFVGSDAPNRDIPNPLFIPSLAPLLWLSQTIPSSLSAFYGLVFGVPSQVIRYRRAERAQRQQMKWLLLFFVPFGILLVLQAIIDLLASSQSKGFSEVSSTFILVWFMAFPVVAVGNAILRHRLYDIDIIIRRTLIYAILTGILAAVYFGGIILTQQLFRAATGQSSDLAIVVSTLLIAALFTPVRRRVQDVIDRRLYRRKYDVEQTLADFQKNLREDVEMETLKANLIGVVNDTMQPTKIALWVRENRS
jgi:putative effector of murein hydrolase LrgA (UPF0299 family)